MDANLSAIPTLSPTDNEGAWYVEESTLSGHSDTVIAVAFSPDARYLASASEDGVILVFSTTSWKPIRRFVDVSPASALIWHPTFKNTIICGFKNGDVLTFCFEHGDRETSHKKVWADGFDGSVECIGCDRDGKTLALGHGNHVSLADQVTVSSWKSLRRIPNPPIFPAAKDPMDPPRARSVHFIDDDGKLIVSFLDHGIVCYDVSELSIVWTIVPRTCHIGHSTVSLDEKHIVVSNLYDGLDWYSIADRSLSHTIQSPINQQMNLPVQLLFTHDGYTIITGGTCGSARILDANTCETVQTLPHGGDIIQAVDHCILEDDASLIALGISGLGDETTIKIWVSEVENTNHTLATPDDRAKDANLYKHNSSRWFLDIAFGVLSILCLFFVTHGYDIGPESVRRNGERILRNILTRLVDLSGRTNPGGGLYDH